MPPKSQASAISRVLLFAVCCLFAPQVIAAQDKAKYDPNRPVEFLAVDSEVQTLLDSSRSSCGQPNIDDTIDRLQKALRIADSRGLVHDRALVEAILASTYVGQGNLELAFKTFQRALQDASDSRNGVLEADILIALAFEAQGRGNTPQALDLVSRALSTAEKSGSLYEKARALGELGKLKLFQGKTDEGAQLIDEALRIDKLNGYG